LDGRIAVESRARPLAGPQQVPPHAVLPGGPTGSSYGSISNRPPDKRPRVTVKRPDARVAGWNAADERLEPGLTEIIRIDVGGGNPEPFPDEPLDEAGVAADQSLDGSLSGLNLAAQPALRSRVHVLTLAQQLPGYLAVMDCATSALDSSSVRGTYSMVVLIAATPPARRRSLPGRRPLRPRWPGRGRAAPSSRNSSRCARGRRRPRPPGRPSRECRSAGGCRSRSRCRHGRWRRRSR